MPTNRPRDGHNVAVTRSVLPPRVRTAFVALLVAPALVLTACGSESQKKPEAQPSVDLPTGNVDVPSGVTLTKAGTALKFGETADVAYSANPKRGSTLAITVSSVQEGKLSDLAAYQLDAGAKKSRLYYMHAVVKNTGSGDLSHMTVPLYGVDSSNALVRQSSFSPTFKKCPSTPFPAGFTQGKSANVCLVYLVPRPTTITAVSYRPLQAFEPITWKGTIKPAPAGKPTKKPAKKQQQKKG